LGPRSRGPALRKNKIKIKKKTCGRGASGAPPPQKKQKGAKGVGGGPGPSGKGGGEGVLNQNVAHGTFWFALGAGCFGAREFGVFLGFKGGGAGG